jgi:hypothetical protein
VPLSTAILPNFVGFDNSFNLSDFVPTFHYVQYHPMVAHGYSSYRNVNPAAIAMAAPISVFRKLITSLVIHLRLGLSCNVAPNILSMLVAMNAAATDISRAGAGIKPTAHPYNDNSSPPSTAAAVPSADTAPSVPGSTRSRVVIKNVVLPYALPISEANVSANLVDSEAT